MRKAGYILFNILILFSLLNSQSSEKLEIRSASEYDYPPFCIVNPDGTAGGFSVELLNAACEAMNMNVSFKVDEWSVIKEELTKGKIDALPMVARTSVREHIYDFTFPYLTYHGAVFVNKNGLSIKTLDDLKNKAVTVLKSDISEEYVREVDLSDNIITTSSFEEAFTALEKGECDAVIAQRVMGLKLVNQLELKNITPLNIKLDGFKQNFCFAVKDGNSELLANLNEGLSIVIADGTFERLQNKWFSPTDDFKQTRLIIGGDKDYPPYEFIDENGNPEGYNVELVKAIAKKLGILIDIRLGAWSEIRNELLNGEIDAISGMYYTKERDKYFEFSPPHLVTDHVIVTRKGSNNFNELSELKGKTILVMEGDVIHDYLLVNGFDKEIKTVPSQEEALLVLSKEQYDCAVTAKFPAQYYIKKYKLENLRISEKPFLPNDYCFAVKEGNEETLGHIYDAISDIKASGEYKKIYDKWFGKFEERSINLKRTIKYALAILIPVIIFLFVIIFWNRSLQVSVNKKTKELKENEALLYGLFDNMPSGSAVYEVKNKGESGSDYIIKFFNKKSLKIENMELKDVLNKSLKDLRPNIDEFGLIPVLKRVWQTGKTEFFPTKIYKDNKYSNYYENIVFRLPGGEVVTIYEDVTEKMNTQYEIMVSETKYRQIFESASEGIFMTKPDGTILSANPEACRILGRSEKEITELGRDKLFDVNDPKFIESLRIRRTTGKFRGEITAFGKDGTKIFLMLTSNIYKDSNGEEKTITIFSDISERKKDESMLREYLKELEQNKVAMLNVLKDVNTEVAVRRKAQEDLKKLNYELEEKVKERTSRLEKHNRELKSAQDSLILLLEDVNETRKELEVTNRKLFNANKELEAFSYSVSHDLRAPLRAILGFANILKEDYCRGLDEDGLRYLNKINSNTTKMQMLIDDLLEFSRVGRSTIKPTILKTRHLLQKIFEEVSESEQERKFDFYVDEKIPDIKGDRTLVTQLFNNIIGNAVKFTSKKDVAEIRINYENDGEFHIISVKDNGAGFDENYKQKIFEVFQRLHGTEFPGTGVGMSIVAKVAAKHGWSLDAESRNGNGATFYIKIPIKDKKEAGNEKRV